MRKSLEKQGIKTIESHVKATVQNNISHKKMVVVDVRELRIKITF